MSSIRNLTITLALSALAAALGAWAGGEFVIHRMKRPVPFHEMLHQKLRLTADQEARIGGIEREYRQRRRVLESEMRAANADLARAFQANHAYSPEDQAAIDRFHRAMSELQRETVVHVLAMRQALTPEQAERFDESVVTLLTADQM